ncbi:unnamed protein product, partial [marine sediment metagenome]
MKKLLVLEKTGTKINRIPGLFHIFNNRTLFPDDYGSMDNFLKNDFFKLINNIDNQLDVDFYKSVLVDPFFINFGNNMINFKSFDNDHKFSFVSIEKLKKMNKKEKFGKNLLKY